MNYSSAELQAPFSALERKEKNDLGIHWQAEESLVWSIQCANLCVQCVLFIALFWMSSVQNAVFSVKFAEY